MEINNTKTVSNSKNETSNTANTTSANHSAPQQAKPFNLKKRKRKAPAGWQHFLVLPYISIMKLYYANLSPYTRKVIATAMITGLLEKIEIIDLMTTGKFIPTPELKKANPLGKIPALIIANGEAVVDSPVICEYLDTKSVKGSIYPKDEEAYFLQKKYEALSDGCTDAVLLRRYESVRPPQLQSVEWDAKQKEKIALAFEYFDSIAPKLGTSEFFIGEISIVAMIDYTNVRFPQENWLATAPNLKKWYDQVSVLPLFSETAPKIQVFQAILTLIFDKGLVRL